jgi:chemotaxis protein CheC
MELTLDRRDALTELINIGYGRAAGALSELTGYRITLEVPKVAIHSIEDLPPMLEEMLGPSIASVNQAFTGPVSGNAILMMDELSAVTLTRLLSDESAAKVLDSNAREILTEVGNILLNACLGVFGNLLQIQVNFAVPRMHVESATQLVETAILYSEEKLSHGLVIHTRFKVKASDVTGYLVIVLGIASLDRLMLEIDDWEGSQLK